jgi:glutamyl-tRNA synthetase
MSVDSMTMQGMLRRGLQLSALREFILHQGASRNVTYHEWDKIWTINKKVIDPVCPRHTAVEVHGRVPVRLTGGPESIEIVEVPRHNKYPPAGTKKQLRSSVSMVQLFSPPGNDLELYTLDLLLFAASSYSSLNL